MTEIPASCLAYDEDLSALIDEELESGREAVVRAHVDACAQCRQRLQDLCNVDLALANAVVPAVATDLRQRLGMRIAEEARGASGRRAPPRRRGFGGALRAASLAAVAAAVVLALYATLRPAEPLAPAAPAGAVAAELESLPAEDLAVLLELDAIEDLDVIANLHVLEHLVALEEEAG